MTLAPLPPFAALRQQLRKHVLADLRGIRLAVAAELPCAAFAYGDLVVLSPSALRLAPRDLLALVVHELVHVFQQRAGRTAARRADLVLDPALEAEADAAAARVARGECVRLAARSGRVARPVLQPKLVLGGHPIMSASDLPANVCRLIGLVPQAGAWLDWAISTNDAAFEFADGASLLTGITQGLHDSSAVLFQPSGLICSPAVLLRLDDSDFSLVAGALECGQFSPGAVSALAKNGICTPADFSQAETLLSSCAPAAPTFGASLADWCAWRVTLLSASSITPAAAPAAGSFASAQSNTLAGFTAAWDFYCTLAPTASAPGLPAAFWNALVPFALPLLSCPVLSPTMPDAVLLDMIGKLAASHAIGFSSLNHALANLGLHAGLACAVPLDEAAARSAVSAYFRSQNTIVQPEGAFVRHLQDGVTRWIFCANSHGRAVCQLDAAGQLTLLNLIPA